ncbi:MAG: hypothetical protein HN714_04770, partial [Formosa sp.]|nr:hypothetical protein [Formosa sp.]
MKNALFYSLFVSIFCVSFQVSAQCEFPETYEGNTGSNMTVMLTSTLINSLEITDENAYLVALSQDGLVVGSKDLFGLTQTSLAIWGNDTNTSETDGAAANEVISFQLVNGTELFDVTFATSVSFVSNGLSAQTNAATVVFKCGIVAGCTDETAINFNDLASLDDGSCIAAIPGCTDSEFVNFNPQANQDDGSCVGYCEAWYLEFEGSQWTGANMQVAFSDGFMNSFSVTDENAYLVAVTEANLVVGSAKIFGVSSVQMTIYGDDVSGEGIDGAQENEEVSFFIVDGTDMYSTTENVVYLTNSTSLVTSESNASLLCVANGPLGCTNIDACNYDASFNTEDGSCEFAADLYDCDEVCLNDSDSDGICDELEVAGCTNPV